MNRFSTAALCLLLAAGCGSSSGTDKTATEKDVVFISGALFLPGNGEPVEGAVMIIENGMITQVGKKGELFAPKNALPIDLEGKTIAPLLINLHGYPGLGNLSEFGAKNYKRESLSADLNRYGYYGVGAVLAGGDSDGLAFQLRDEINEGKTTGAQLYTSGRGIAAKGSSGIMGNIPILVSGDADARKAVGELADRNANAIVLWASGLKPEAANAVVDEAHKRKLKVFADAPTLAEAKTLAKAGVDALISSVRDREVDDEFVSLMKDKKIPLSPALTALEARFVYAEKTSWLGEVAMREAYPPSISAYLSEPVIMNQFKRNPQIGTFRTEFATASKNLKKLADAGVPIVLGSGSGLPDTFPGYFEHRELALMVNAGMTPLAAINAATSVSAEVLGATDLGTLEPGKKGNFIVFASNPIEDIRNTRDIDKVFIEGHPIDRLDMIRTIQVERPKVSQAQIAADAEIQRREREEAEDRNLPKYGKYAMGGNVNVAPGLIIQTPKRSKATPAGGGPPYRVTVQLERATGADLKAFYTALLPKANWKASGDCWDKANPAQPGKNFHLCTEAGPTQITLNISVQ